eukprot:11879492-Alexandrium_andersonii.AAC.1
MEVLEVGCGGAAGQVDRGQAEKAAVRPGSPSRGDVPAGSGVQLDELPWGRQDHRRATRPARL